MRVCSWWSDVSGLSLTTFLIIWMTQHHHHSWQDSCPSFSVYSQHVLWSHQTSFLQVHGDDDNDDEQNHDDDDDDTVHQWEWNLQRIITVQVEEPAQIQSTTDVFGIFSNFLYNHWSREMNSDSIKKTEGWRKLVITRPMEWGLIGETRWFLQLI